MTIDNFLTWLRQRRADKETLRGIGDTFGVTHVTVIGWLSGSRKPSKSILILAGLLKAQETAK